MKIRVKREPKPTSASLPPGRDWLFRKAEVPDEELVACVCWEYLREIRPGDLGEKGLANYALRLLTAYRIDSQRRKFADSYEGTSLRVLAFLADQSAVLQPLQPWQELGHEMRQELSQKLPRAWEPLIPADVIGAGVTSWTLNIPAPEQPLAARSWTEQAPEVYAFAVAYLAHHSAAESQRMPGVGVTVRRAQDFQPELPAPSDPRHWLGLFAANGFAAPAPFLINWAEYNVEEIIEAFEKWARASQPGLAPGLRQQGTSLSDLRAHLRDLGALRIMKVMTEDKFKSLDAECDLLRESGRGTRAKAVPSLDLGKLRNQAVEYFQRLFALLPEQKPGSWQPRRPRGKNTLAKTGKRQILGSLAGDG